MMLSLLLNNALLVLALMLALWAWSVFRRDASIVDPWWSIGFLVISLNTFTHGQPTLRKGLLLGMVTVWALRLWLHLLWRSRGKPEDPRYQRFRERFGRDRYWWVSLFQVFLLQGGLLIFISSPLQVALASPSELSWLDGVGIALFAVGFSFEAIGDFQLQRFRSDPSRRGTVLDTGLWRYTRHPNYFGEAVLWWGFACFSVTDFWTLSSPVLMTFLLLRVSGVTMLEAQLLETRPAYRDYVRATSAFIPWRRSETRPGQ